MQQFNTFIRASLSADDNQIFNASFANGSSFTKTFEERNSFIKIK